MELAVQGKLATSIGELDSAELVELLSSDGCKKDFFLESVATSTPKNEFNLLLLTTLTCPYLDPSNAPTPGVYLFYSNLA